MGSLLKRRVVLLVLCVMLVSMAGTPVRAQSTKRHLFDRSRVNNRSLRIKFKAGSGVSIQNNEFVAADPTVAARLNAIMKKSKKNKAEPLAQKADGDNVVTRSLQQYSSVKFDQDIDTDGVVKELEALGVIDEAYAQPLPAPAPVTADYKGLQQYLKAAPGGVDSAYASTVAGGTGDRAKIVDIEYSWNQSHEDLTKASVALVPYGFPVDPFNDKNHGTAVLGEMIGTNNSYGVSGVAFGAGIELINANSSDRGWDIAGALSFAAGRTVPGDVIIVEQQVWGPTASGNDFMPVEWTPEIYDAIKALTTAGRIVVEPAGNGYHNLDDPLYTNGTTFPLGKPDSGAIIVGAGENCGGLLRSRLYFTNYGKRINLQGPGNCVATTGYGDLSKTSINSFYTNTFGGTSSATPVVAAAAAVLSSVYEATHNGQVMNPAQVRSTLMTTGTPQNTTIAGNIGSYPNLKAALAGIAPVVTTDTTPPTVPSGVTVKLNSSKKPVLAWIASTDNVGVATYSILRNGVFYKSVAGTVVSFTDTSVTWGKTYSYTIKAIDTSNNKSAVSKAVSILVK
ncbi:hypothetical protein BH10PAT3_BH10PAT3_7020 [soil metagenome]